MARRRRDTYKYRFCAEDGREVHCGITNDLERREGEHQERFDQPGGFIEQVGRRTTRAAAMAWEREQRCSPYDRDEAGSSILSPASAMDLEEPNGSAALIPLAGLGAGLAAHEIAKAAASRHPEAWAIFTGLATAVGTAFALSND